MDIPDISKSFASKKNKGYISTTMSTLINDLIAAELNASQLYKSMATWCEYTGFEGLSAYMNKHTLEERIHMDKLYEYALDRQVLPITPSVKTQPITFIDLKDVLDKALSHEELIEDTYKKAVMCAWTDKDITTFTFFQWFLTEQIEEIKKFSGFLDRLNIIGNDKKGQYFLDTEIGCLIK